MTVTRPDLSIVPVEGQPGQWRIEIRGNANGPDTLKIKCGHGTTPRNRESIMQKTA